MDGFKACRSSRSTRETHVALSHVSFGCPPGSPHGLERGRKRGSRAALGGVQGLPGLPQHGGNSRGSEPREFWPRADSPTGLEPALEWQPGWTRGGPGPDPGRTRGGPGPDPVRTRPGPGPTYVPWAMPMAAERLPECPPTRLGTLSCAMLQCQVHSESTFWVKRACFRRRAGIPFGPNRLQQDTRARFVILQTARKTPGMRSWLHLAGLGNTSQSTRKPHFADGLSKIRSARVPADSAWHSWGPQDGARKRLRHPFRAPWGPRD